MMELIRVMLEEDEGWSIGEGGHGFGVGKRRG
jgi:hypothetical protein